MSKLSGHSIIVTGASRGLGRATVEACIREGAYVGLNYLHSEAEANEMLMAHPNAIELLRFDVTDHAAACSMIRGFVKRRGRLDAIVNNAGVLRPRLLLASKELGDVPQEIRVNLLGPMICTQAVLPQFLKAKSGTIVNISSCAVTHPDSGQSIYAASKAGVEAFTKAIAIEYANKGIHAVCLRLGPADTDMLRGAGREVYESMAARTLLNRLSAPEEIGSFIATLLSGNAAMTVGSVLDLTMGYPAR
jgi:3-oxoacyl-[acyl-carrier protein] reductase